MSSEVVTSSRVDKIRTRSATKAILDFACLFLRLPKLGRKVMIGMIAGSEVINFEKACTNKECKKALLEAYEGTEVLKQLADSLDDRGVRERALKDALADHLPVFGLDDVDD